MLRKISGYISEDENTYPDGINDALNWVLEEHPTSQLVYDAAYYSAEAFDVEDVLEENEF